ncbi:hypothetical protein [Cryobacterium zhongshanensis]|uniref:Uncharacterized protein n=1 Tax=Cryobacterium zhongshanensis TaxID=2928153 RepID=A0AA41QZK7_9MICO|nr:hypothetical protein [Cryobacterium zhongshanensis]MCI4659719.1 hypothetical protein [Cryobacterium zhongshanensis]
MTSQRRDVATLPIDQRGHQQIHLEYLKAEQTGFVKNDSTPGAHIEWMNPVYIYEGAFDCAACGEYPAFSVEVDEAGEPTKLVAKSACALTEGVPMVIELAVPSGKMIVHDSLARVFDFDLMNYNSKLGQAQAQQIMAAQGCAFGPVGNTSPSLVKTGEGAFIIANIDDELEPGEEGYVVGEKLASICTDLWAYSIADLDHFVATARAQLAAASDKERVELVKRELFRWAVQPGDPRDRIDQLGWTVTVVNVTPGTYRFTHHTGEVGFDSDDWPATYAHVELVA